MTEVWKPIPGEEHYEVSNLGRVKSLRRNLILRPYAANTYRKVRLRMAEASGHMFSFKDSYKQLFKVKVLRGWLLRVLVTQTFGAPGSPCEVF